eukprot:2857121-Rhodomonas_salina.2
MAAPEMRGQRWKILTQGAQADLSLKCPALTGGRLCSGPSIAEPSSALFRCKFERQIFPALRTTAAVQPQTLLPICTR